MQYTQNQKKNGKNQLMVLEDGRTVYDIAKFPQYIAGFKYWDLVAAAFPYDRVADVHHLLISKRIYAHSSDMTIHERAELESIKEQYAETYHCMISNLDMGKSVFGTPSHTFY